MKYDDTVYVERTYVCYHNVSYRTYCIIIQWYSCYDIINIYHNLYILTVERRTVSYGILLCLQYERTRVPVLYDCTRPGTLYYVPYSRYYADAATNKLLCVYRS